MKFLLLAVLSTALVGLAASPEAPAQSEQPAVPQFGAMRSVELSGTIIKRETTTDSGATATIYGIRTTKAGTVRLPASKTLDYGRYLNESVVVTGRGYTSTVGGRKRLHLKQVSGVNPIGLSE